MAKHSLLVVVALLLPPLSAGAQTVPGVPARNAVYLELLGNGGLYSLNYERKVSDQLGVRVGAAIWTATDFFASDAETDFITAPLLLNYLLGRGNNHLELGAGVLVGRKNENFASGTGSETSTIFNLTGVLGYRYERPAGGVLFRAGFTPFFSFSDEDDAYPDAGFFPSVGLSVGYAF